MPKPQAQLNLLQQFGRFLVIGALAFTLAFWGASMVLISAADAHRNFAAVRIILKSCTLRSFAIWFGNLEVAYIPFFLRQRSLLACYFIATTLAWLAAFAYDGRILRQENTL